MVDEMKEVMDLRLEIDSQNRSFKWQDPELIDLAGRRQRAQGNCVLYGSGNDWCGTGNNANGGCESGINGHGP